MQPLQRILAGIAIEDESLTPGSIAALRQAAWLAHGTGAALTLLHSTYDDVRGEPGPMPPDEILDDALEIAARRGVQAEFEVVDDDPWLALVRRAVRGAANLVVVGRHNTGIHELGSVAMKCLRLSPAPVWATHADAPSPPRRILVATDLSPAADAATALATRIAALGHAALRVLHAWQLPFEAIHAEGRTPGSPQDEARERIESAALAHIRSTLAPGDGVNAQIHIVRDAPWRAIVHEVDAQESDLVALATVARTGIPGFVVGNTAERLLRKLNVSLLAVKPEGFVSPVTA